MNIRENLTFTECNAEMTAIHRTVEELSITIKEDVKAESVSFISINTDPIQHYSLELDHGTATFQNKLIKNKFESEYLKSENWNLNYPSIDSVSCANKNTNENLCSKPKTEIVSLPLSIHKVDKKYDDLLWKLLPTLKIEPEANPGTDLSQNTESALYEEENTSLAANHPVAKEKKLISSDIPPGFSCPEIANHTGSTASASREIGTNDLNPVVVLKRLSFPGIGSVQAKQDSLHARNEFGQQSQELRSSAIGTNGTSYYASAKPKVAIGRRTRNSVVKHYVKRVSSGIRNPYICVHCDKSFAHKGSLKRHLVTHTGEELYTYKQCVKPFRDKRDLSYHMTTNKGDKLYACGECGKSFRCKSILTRHTITHTGQKAYMCEQCGKSFGQKSHLNTHILTHTGLKAYTFKQCGKSFVHKRTLNYHTITHTGQKNNTCEQCGKSFRDKGDLHYHMTTHTGKKLYTCGQCMKSFGCKSNLRRHMITHTGQKAYTCEQCSKSFGDKKTLISHMITHTGQKCYRCEQCGKSFGQRSHLYIHMIIHTGKKDYTCIQCGKSFGYKRTLNHHMVTHTGQNPYTCEQCGKSFSSKSNLDSHVTTHTGQRAYICEQCGKSFAYKCSLRIHMITHTDQKPYTCEQCGRSFGDKSY